MFAVLAHTDKATIDPLDVSQWKFYVLTHRRAERSERSQHSITLRTIEKEHGPELAFCDLAGAVGRAAPTGDGWPIASISVDSKPLGYSRRRGVDFDASGTAFVERGMANKLDWLTKLMSGASIEIGHTF